MAFSTLLLLKIDGCGFHTNSLLLTVDNLIPDFLYFLLLVFDSFGLRLEFSHHKLLDYTEFEFLFLLKNLKDK